MNGFNTEVVSYPSLSWLDYDPFVSADARGRSDYNVARTKGDTL